MAEPRDQLPPTYIASNPWASAYASRHTNPEGGLVDLEELELLQHVNCSYLSSGTAPTLLVLKQHAQSLTNFIRKISPATKSSAVAELDIDENSWGFPANEPFDWLNNLDKPYTNDDDSHNIPLWSLANEIKSDSEYTDLQRHCPLSLVVDSGPLAEKNEFCRPYMTHHNLVRHANECLEIIDHEYSATGGLMSILPPPTDQASAEAICADNTLLGQWLLHHQTLVGRMHELEINYANAIDALEGEAVVPFQITRRAGPDGVAGGREVAYPQDRYVLVNAGDDVTGFIHRTLDRAEAVHEEKQNIWLDSGVSGERMWAQNRGGGVNAKGVIPVDLLTRFYRIAGKGHESPIFVMPAIEQHPGVSHTRKIEKQSTVVSTVAPIWPKRVSEWEKNFQAQIDAAQVAEHQVNQARSANFELGNEIIAKDEEIQRVKEKLAFWETNGDKNEAERHEVLLGQISAYKAKIEQLKRELPDAYQPLLEIGEF